MFLWLNYLSNEKNLGWLGYIGDYTTRSHFGSRPKGDFYLSFLKRMDTRLFDQQLFRAIYQARNLISVSSCPEEGAPLIWSDSTFARAGLCLKSPFGSVNIVASSGKCAQNFDRKEELFSSPSSTAQV